VDFSSGGKFQGLSTIFRKPSTAEIVPSYPCNGAFGIFHKMHSTTTKYYSPERKFLWKYLLVKTTFSRN